MCSYSDWELVSPHSQVLSTLDVGCGTFTITNLCFEHLVHHNHICYTRAIAFLGTN